MPQDTAEDLRAVLASYKLVKDASWPDLNPGLRTAEARWPAASGAELARELQAYVDETNVASCTVRVFWKIGRDLTFAGCNRNFAKDAGLASPAELIGLDDFSSKLPWAAQAAKYRFDDKEIVDSGLPKLDILERQNSASGVVWVLVGKAPIRVGARSIGILGMYQHLDNDKARKLFAERSRQGR
jgi:hypothetical protein